MRVNGSRVNRCVEAAADIIRIGAVEIAQRVPELLES